MNEDTRYLVASLRKAVDGPRSDLAASADILLGFAIQEIERLAKRVDELEDRLEDIRQEGLDRDLCD